MADRDLFRYRIMASYVPTRDRGGNVSHLYTRDVDDVICSRSSVHPASE